MTKSTAVLALSVVALAAMIVLPAALAAKGTGKGPSTGSSVEMNLNGDTNGNGVANWGETVTFTLDTSATQPYVNLRCRQGDAVVYDAWAGFYAGAWFSRDFPLSSQSWTGGSADCTARLVVWSRNGRETTLATTSFPVEA